jgi:hypothetical protein
VRDEQQGEAAVIHRMVRGRLPNNDTLRSGLECRQMLDYRIINQCVELQDALLLKRLRPSNDLSVR